MTSAQADTAIPLAGRLKALTRDLHERLDRSIMTAAAFDDTAGYARFVTIQYRFHRDLAPLYDDRRLAAIVPDLATRDRLDRIAADLADLGASRPDDDAPPTFVAETIDIPTALGWLYVAEGSNLGAALLRKEAAKLGLSDDHGARHLAPAAEGPAAQWRRFTSMLDQAGLTDAEEARAIEGARAAFTRVQTYVDAA